MSKDREIALEQALVAVLGAVHELGLDVGSVSTKAKGLIIDHSEYRWVEHPHVTNACKAIDEAIESTGIKSAVFQTQVK